MVFLDEMFCWNEVQRPTASRHYPCLLLVRRIRGRTDRKTLTIRLISLEGIGTECVGARSFLWAALYRVSLAPASASTI